MTSCPFVCLTGKIINEWPSSSQEDNMNTPHHWSRCCPSSLNPSVVSPWPHSPAPRSRCCWTPSSCRLEKRGSGSGCTAWLGKCWSPAKPGCPTPWNHHINVTWTNCFSCVTFVMQPHTIIVQIVYCDVSIQLRELNLCLPYGLILRGLDHRGAARHPTHMGHLKMNRIE